WVEDGVVGCRRGSPHRAPSAFSAAHAGHSGKRMLSSRLTGCACGIAGHVCSSRLVASWARVVPGQGQEFQKRCRTPPGDKKNKVLWKHEQRRAGACTGAG